MTTGDLFTTFTINTDPNADPVDLTTLADVRAFLQEQDLDTQQDPIIQKLITRASSAILRWTGREFTPRVDGQPRVLSFQGSRLDLAPYEARAITSVSLDGTALIADTDYYARPLPATNGVLGWLELPAYPATASTVPRTITVTGDWGWPAVPEDVQHACIVTVAIWLKRDVAAFSRTFNLDEGRTERPDALPSAARAILEQYRVPVIA